MFISTAYAQGAGGGGGGGLEAMLPLVLIFVVFYFLLIRPQQKKMKEHKGMLEAMRRGDKVVTGGGIVGTITKVDDDFTITIEIAKDVKVKVQRALINQVISKNQPAPDAAPANENKSGGGGLGALFGFGGKKAEAPAQPASNDAAPVDDAADGKADDAVDGDAAGETDSGDKK